MDKKIKKKWVAALRSGEYQQCKGALNVLDLNDEFAPGFCCLGVLCEVVDATKVREEFGVTVYELMGDTFTTVIPDDFCGIHHSDKDNLIEMNDHGESFEEIANYIEKNL